MLRAADGSPGGHPLRDNPPALQTAGQQTVGAFTQSSAVDTHLSHCSQGTRVMCCKELEQMSSVFTILYKVIHPMIIRDNQTTLCTYAILCVL